MVQEVDGVSLAGMSHSAAARTLAESYARKDRPEMVLVVRDHR